ncbi:MAG TPA: lipopolysaccharide heptosyltransferase family protein [Chromatiales bacterium]|nr:lipopolysaccharide heptosyltransferase family protein [Chromatiales bacterium]
MKLWFKNGGWASGRGRRVAASIDPAAIKKIAVIRHAALGDMVLTRPFLIELRGIFPNAEITLSLCSNYTRGAPEDLVDRLHVVYGSDRKEVPLKEQIARVRELGEQDLIFDLAVTPRSFYTCLLTRAKLKISFPYKAIQRRLFYDVAVQRSDFQFEADNILDMLRIFGYRVAYPPQFLMPVEPFHHPRPYVVYFPSASTPTRCWPKGLFSQLVGALSEKFPQYDHIVLKGIGEWETIDEIVDPLAGQNNVSAMQLNDFDETLSFVKGASLLVGNDTGIRHVAIACETPTIGIFFDSEPYRYWPRYDFHDAVFCSDATVPSLSAVQLSAEALLARLARSA